MPELFTISDLHLGHENILKFLDDDGMRVRDFPSISAMHVRIVEAWNSVVTPKDKVYVLGDVAMRKDALPILGLLNGKKALIRGNHDTFSLNAYRPYFYEVYGVRQIDRIWFTHVPMWEGSVGEARVKGNVHGHLHTNTINHRRYRNVCVEQVDYTPVTFDDCVEFFKYGRGFSPPE